MLKDHSDFHPKHWIVESTVSFFLSPINETQLQGVQKQLQIYSVCQCVERCHDDRAQSVVTAFLWIMVSTLSIWRRPASNGVLVEDHLGEP